MTCRSWKAQRILRCAVLDNFVLHHVPKAVGEEYFVQWARVLLQPNGRLLFVSVWEGTGDQDMGDMLSPGQQVYFHRWSKPEILQWASEAGMKLIYERECVETDFGIENTYYAVSQD